MDFKYFVWTFAKEWNLNQVYLITYLILILNVIMTICFSWIIFNERIKLNGIGKIERLLYIFSSYKLLVYFYILANNFSDTNHL